MRTGKLSQLPLLTRLYLAVLPALCVLLACLLSVWKDIPPKPKSLTEHLQKLTDITLSRNNMTPETCSVTPLRAFRQDGDLQNENVSYFLVEMYPYYEIVMQYENKYYYEVGGWLRFKGTNPYEEADIPLDNRYIAPLGYDVCLFGTKIGDRYYDVKTGEALSAVTVDDWAESAALLLPQLPDRIGFGPHNVKRFQ